LPRTDTGVGGVRRPLVELLVAFVGMAGLLGWLQFTTPSICCGDFDGYYHIRLSQLMWQSLHHGDFPPTFTWLPLTTLNPRQYADQHFLFHILLIPFTWFGDLTTSTKVAVVLFSTLAVVACYGLLLRHHVPYARLWLVALTACSADFFFRLNMTRASSLSIIYMAVAIGLLFERRYVWLAPLGFLYAWTYNLFVFLGIITLIWIAVVWWVHRQIEWRALLWACVGMAAGLVINPYFPHDVTLLFEHIFAKGGHSSIAAGTEWYSVPSWMLVKRSVVAFAAMVIGYIGVGYLLGLGPDQRRHRERPLFFLVFSTFLLLITVRSSRFTEYWPPFAVLFAAFTVGALWEARRRAVWPSEGGVPSPRPGPRQALALTAASAALATAMVYNLYVARSVIATVEEKKARDHYAEGMHWVQQHIPLGAMIYNLNWDDFPKLFYYDTSHAYVAGLDPVYFADKNPELSRLYERIRAGLEADPAPLIRDRFGASYVVVGNRFPQAFYPSAMKTEKFGKTYEDQDIVVLEIVR
jgi:asparagine N-glycosylation enzyme membrane subunit Stt3